MAIGDNYNDMEMLAFAGHPFIMGNASEELRGRGWKLTRSNAESGVTAAIEHALSGTPLDLAITTIRNEGERGNKIAEPVIDDGTTIVSIL